MTRLKQEQDYSTDRVVDRLTDLIAVGSRFRTIYADPPWLERGGGRIRRGADRHYPLMTTNEILALPIADLAAENAHCFVWATNNHLPDGFRVLDAWGFSFCTMITWVKDGRLGLGQYFRGLTEHCLFGVRGRLPYRMDGNRRLQGVTAIIARPTRHSAKPEEMRRMIEAVSYPPYLELFARRPEAAWTYWGNEA
jgi:N6-adenosine-specific RNA methylase IME4